MDVFIHDIAAFLPNEPVTNDQIESVLGRLDTISAKTRRVVLKNNQIKTRYYAIDPDTGKLTHTNAQLAAEAVRRLAPHEGFQLDAIECLCCGTTSPDLLLPGHGLMVLGELGIPECEAVTTSGICISGMTALKFAWMNVACGMSANAVATGSELSSSYMRAGFLANSFLNDEPDIENKPSRAFDAAFLRWMLSDGAGAAFLSSTPNTNRLSLKVDWIENISYAGQLETCMYAGGVKTDTPAMVGWRETEKIPPEQKPYLFNVRQDIRLLDKYIVPTMGRSLSKVVAKYDLTPDRITWFLPHYSSAYFRPKFYEEMKRIGFEIPESRWFTNLPQKGNTGSAAIYIILEELFHSGQLKSGDTLLCFVPESGRFSHCYMMLTAVKWA